MSGIPPGKGPGKQGEKKRKLDSSGREFVTRERGGKRANQAKKLARQVLEGFHEPRQQWSEQKRIEFERLVDIQERRRELDRLEKEATQRFAEASQPARRAGGAAEEGPGVEDFVEVEIDALELAAFEAAEARAAETEAPKTPSPTSPKSSRKKGKGKKKVGPTRVPPTKAPAKASAVPEPIAEVAAAPATVIAAATSKVAAPEAKVASKTAKTAPSKPKISTKAPTVPKVPAKAAASVEESASASGISRTVPPHLSFGVSGYFPTVLESDSEEGFALPKFRGSKRPRTPPKDPAPAPAPAKASVPAVAKGHLSAAVAGQRLAPTPKVAWPPAKRTEGVKGREDKSVRLVLDYHCVLDLDLDRSRAARRNIFYQEGVYPGAQQALIEGVRAQPNLEIAVLSYIGKYSADKRKATREKVRAFQVAVRRAGLRNQVSCVIVDE